MKKNTIVTELKFFINIDLDCLKIRIKGFQFILLFLIEKNNFCQFFPEATGFYDWHGFYPNMEFC